MFDTPNKSFLIRGDLKYSLWVYFWTCIGIFFFILFFQPFEPVVQDFNSKLVFVAGLATISFVSMVLFYIVAPWLFPRALFSENQQTRLYILINVFLWIFSSTAYAFYIRYLGQEELSIFLVIRMVILSMVPILILAIIRENEYLRNQVFNLREHLINIKLDQKDKNEDEPIRFASENRSDVIELHSDDVLLINSAENYVEIVYKENGSMKKKLIRTTLKNIEEQLKKNPDFLRCHRTTIINTKYILKLHSGYQGHYLIIHGYDGEVPVSRQYLLSIRDFLEEH